MKTIKFPENTWFTGRNGLFKASGIELTKDSKDDLLLIPETSKHKPAHCDIVIHKDAIPEFISSIESMFNIQRKADPIYFLFGLSASAAFNEGMEEMQEYIESGEEAVTYVYTGNVIELMSEFNGWDDYIILTEEEYNTISDL